MWDIDDYVFRRDDDTDERQDPQPSKKRKLVGNTAESGDDEEGNQCERIEVSSDVEGLFMYTYYAPLITTSFFVADESPDSEAPEYEVDEEDLEEEDIDGNLSERIEGSYVV